MSLKCVGISQHFNGQNVLTELSVTFPDFGLVGIIGPNGAGKTTLLNIISGFLRPNAGDVVLSGIKITGQAPHSIAALGIRRTFQEIRLVHELTLRDHLILVQRSPTVGERSPQLLAEYVQTFHLHAWMEQKVRELSFGQQKLVALACALAGEPRVLLLDEPVAGLDPEMRSRLSAFLRGQRNEMLTVFVEHDLEFVRDLADTLIFMTAGRNSIVGDPGEILRDKNLLEAYLG